MKKEFLILLLLFFISINVVSADELNQTTDSYVKVESNNIRVDQNETLTIEVPQNAGGTLKIEIDDKTDEITIVNQTTRYTLPNLVYGNYSVNVTYSGDNNYSQAFNTTFFSVLKYGAMCNVSYDRYFNAHDPLVVTITAMNDESGNITFSIFNTTNQYILENGQVVITYPDLVSGFHQFRMRYSGNEKYYGRNGTFGIEVYSLNTTISTHARNITEGETEVIEVILANNTTGNVTVVINRQNYTASVENGVAVINISGLEAGNYSGNVYYSGDDYYNSNNTIVNFIVNPFKESETVINQTTTENRNMEIKETTTSTNQTDTGNETTNENTDIKIEENKTETLPGKHVSKTYLENNDLTTANPILILLIALLLIPIRRGKH